MQMLMVSVTIEDTDLDYLGSLWSFRHANVPASFNERESNLSLLQAPVNFHADWTWLDIKIIYIDATGVNSISSCRWASKSQLPAMSLEEMPVAMETECMPEELLGCRTSVVSMPVSRAWFQLNVTCSVLLIHIHALVNKHGKSKCISLSDPLAIVCEGCICPLNPTTPIWKYGLCRT